MTLSNKQLEEVRKQVAKQLVKAQHYLDNAILRSNAPAYNALHDFITGLKQLAKLLAPPPKQYEVRVITGSGAHAFAFACLGTTDDCVVLSYNATKRQLFTQEKVKQVSQLLDSLGVSSKIFESLDDG